MGVATLLRTVPHINHCRDNVPFNYEADTFLWVSVDCESIVRDYVKEQDTPEDATSTRYDEEDNSGITMRQRLECLERDFSQ